jgi:methionyl aminopeptidase
MNRIKYSKVAGNIVNLIISQIKEEIKPGLSGKDLEKLAVLMMKEKKAKSSSLGYREFPSAICVSINDELTHGIPDDRKFVHGDIVSVDVSCSYKGFHADAAVTLLVGEKNLKSPHVELNYKQKKFLIETTKEALIFAISKIIPNKTTTCDIGSFIQSYVENKNLFVIREYGGHGIGRMLHMDPFIPNYKIDFEGEVLRTGMLVCIEPLVQFEDDKIKISSNGKTVVSRNGSLNAHFEHTVFIGCNDVEIIT